MTRLEKLLNRFLENPQSLKFKKIEKILLKMGFQRIDIRGSHHHFSHQSIPNAFSVPVHNNDCGEIYKKEIAKLIIKNFNVLQK